MRPVAKVRWATGSRPFRLLLEVQEVFGRFQASGLDLQELLAILPSTPSTIEPDLEEAGRGKRMARSLACRIGRPWVPSGPMTMRLRPHSHMPSKGLGSRPLPSGEELAAEKGFSPNFAC